MKLKNIALLCVTLLVAAVLLAMPDVASAEDAQPQPSQPDCVRAEFGAPEPLVALQIQTLDLKYEFSCVPGTKGGDKFRAIANGAAAGVTSPYAQQCKIYLGNRRIYVALDAKDRSATSANCLRIDFSGQQNYKNAPCLDLRNHRSNPSMVYATLADSQVVEFPFAGGSGRAAVRAHYMKQSGERSLDVTFNSQRIAELDIADTHYCVHLVDANRNLCYGDTFPGSSIACDYVVICKRIGGSGGKSGKEKPVTMGLLGQPLWLGDAFWAFSSAIDGDYVTAKKVKCPKAVIECGENRLWAYLRGKQYSVVVNVAPGCRQIVPAGDYILQYIDYGKGYNGVSSSAAAARINIPAGEKGGDVLSARPVATMTGEIRNGCVMLNAVITGAGDVPLICGYQEIRLTITDSSGQVVNSGKFEYG